MMNRRRVVITGYGAVSCVGNDVNTMWDALVNGRCGIGRVTQFDPIDFKTQVGGEVKNLDWASVVSEKDYRRKSQRARREAARSRRRPGHR